MHTSRGIQCSETVSGVNTSMLLRGSWEKDETIEVAARHKTIEEAGVCGDIEEKLGPWYFENKSGDTVYEGNLFPLVVIEELDLWSDKDIRERSVSHSLYIYIYIM
ncbi:hypothetical protein BC332_21055 [Capsicum chinense]|nr:hypothetical protein BC332_21055 [Capsicum chinense]